MKERVPPPESDIVYRVKRERLNAGRNYLSYLTPEQQRKYRKRNSSWIIK